MNTISIPIILAAIIILLPKVKSAGKHQFFEHPFPLKITKAMQGFLAFLVMFHQLSVQSGNAAVYSASLAIFSKIGVLIVGFFFFFSGYGLITSYEEKKD